MWWRGAEEGCGEKERRGEVRKDERRGEVRRSDETRRDETRGIGKDRGGHLSPSQYREPSFEKKSVRAPGLTNSPLSLAWTLLVTPSDARPTARIFRIAIEVFAPELGASPPLVSSREGGRSSPVAHTQSSAQL